MRPPPLRGQLHAIAFMLLALASILVLGRQCSSGVARMFDVVAPAPDGGASAPTVPRPGP